jgi:2-dehydro-3-deoxy-D-arabinonate dehydratase
MLQKKRRDGQPGFNNVPPPTVSPLAYYERPGSPLLQVGGIDSERVRSYYRIVPNLIIMKLCRFKNPSSRVCVGLVAEDGTVLDLGLEVIGLSDLLETDDLMKRLASMAQRACKRYALAEVSLLPPLEGQEVWAAGVTYLRSKTARMQESDFSATAYDRVYEAGRPELFFKAMPDKVVGPGDHVGIRRDAQWNVPEPELALVLNSRGQVVGYTIGNDMSSRDIEGENLLYLPQAKIYSRSCALGPLIRVGITEAEARTWTIQLEIERDGANIFRGNTSVGQIKRSFAELAEYLFRSQIFPRGAILLTGTGIVPAETFSLNANDRVRITISGIGTLENSVVVV